MNIDISRFLRKRWLFLLVLALGVGYFYEYAEFRLTDDEWTARLSHTNVAVEVGYHQGPNRRVRYVTVGRDTLPLVVFLHGAPSSSAFWTGFLGDSSLLERAAILAVDRPGYGFSGLGRPEISVQKQAADIASLLRKLDLKHRRIILHGSSYGGTVAARIAMDHPELIDGLLLQSASMAPGREKTFWITYPTSHWSLSWLVPGALHTANTEKLNHRAQLEAMADGWAHIRARTIILHGTDDWLIFPDNAYYACDRLTGTRELIQHMVGGRAHDLLWTEPELLRHSLDYLLQADPDSAGVKALPDPDRERFPSGLR